MSDLILDPAMLADHDTDDSGWEYEYHESEAESFYLNLDLTSQHGPLRPPRRRTGSSHATTENNEDDEADFSRPLNTTEPDAAANGDPSADCLQVLGLHTFNPIVSYQNQIFSCFWADQIGTELFFTHPEPESGPGAESSAAGTTTLTHGRDFDLLAANRVKILGRKANLISSSGVTVPESSTTTATSTAKPSTNRARFLERLANVKQARGETDTVRTVFSTRRTQNPEERLRGWAQTEEQLAEIQRLQEGMMRGDTQAMAALESLYRDQEDG